MEKPAVKKKKGKKKGWTRGLHLLNLEIPVSTTNVSLSSHGCRLKV